MGSARRTHHVVPVVCLIWGGLHNPWFLNQSQGGICMNLRRLLDLMEQDGGCTYRAEGIGAGLQLRTAALRNLCGAKTRIAVDRGICQDGAVPPAHRAESGTTLSPPTGGECTGMFMHNRDDGQVIQGLLRCTRAAQTGGTRWGRIALSIKMKGNQWSLSTGGILDLRQASRNCQRERLYFSAGTGVMRGQLRIAAVGLVATGSAES